MEESKIITKEFRGLLSDRIIGAIKSGQARMRSRWYFVFRNALITVAILILLLIAIFLASFVIFVLHSSHVWFVPIFGLSGWYALFNSLPVILLIFSMVFIGILSLFMKRYPYGYQWPLVYSVLGVFFLIAAVTFIFVQTSVYQELFGAGAASPDAPLIGQYYPGFGILTSGDIHRGQIATITPSGFVLADANGAVLNVTVDSATNFPFDVSLLAAGDQVVVFGPKEQDGSVHAVGISRK